MAVLASSGTPMLGAGLLAAILGLMWLVWPRKEGAIPRRYVVFLSAFAFSSVLPQSVGLPLQIVALVGAFLEWLCTPAAERRGNGVVLTAGLFIGFWALLMFHPNVPDISTGLLGFRKTALAVAGVVFGCAIRERLRVPVERLVINLVTSVLGLSIVGHLWIPAINKLFPKNDADMYTGLYGGEVRMQGLFAGPFHAAIAGVFLIGWAIVRWRSSRVLPKVVLVVGALGMYLTLVRTAYIAVALVVAALVILASSFVSFMKRLGIVSGLALVALMFVEAFGGGKVLTVIESIGNFATDGRFLNRLPEYALGFKMFGESQLVGKGAGSAGDTLGPAFGAHEHVTPHNLLLKILVEGGAIGMSLWLLLIMVLWHALDTRTPPGSLAVVSVLGMFGLGLTGSAIEALPVTYLIFMVAGLGVRAEGGSASSTREELEARPLPLLNGRRGYHLNSR
ncbi:O-antigen ligase family protein [Arthrobacter sp. Soil764]|uniref:O-antigen ligase family protein n=1 Tax=Arthrobacter sp. Soil764 TaxID=1736403 RepID=UPI001F462DFB|nr:O-antigen ligase family protein [Arthrobacter sp. Soil764]